MRWTKFILSLFPTLALMGLLLFPPQPITFSPGAFLDPFHGFWRNAEAVERSFEAELDLPGLESAVEVVIDQRNVPHVFAQSLTDAAYAQGYLHARDRLWQMDFQIMATAGRLTEIVGRGKDDRILDLDRTTRRKGMVFAAERTLEMINQQPDTRRMVEAYAEGINAWIAQLDESSLPIEYKLLNYKPEAWSPLKTALLMKSMANTLSARTRDIDHTNGLMLLGRKYFDLLHPEFPDKDMPIVPARTRFNWRQALPLPRVPGDYRPDSIYLERDPVEKPSEINGSNNWAVAGSRTSTGKPMLANDPHLGLNLPSIWYEIQIQVDNDINVYGVSLPGAPGVVIGFNDSIAWGLTNAGRDVMDFYRTEFRNDKREEYRYDGQWLPVNPRVESFQIRNEAPFLDTVLYTNIGPVMYDRNFGDQPLPLAMRWMAHEPSNDMLAFLGLMRADNYEDYAAAIANHICPAQNFVFASAAGDIAIWQQGKFVNRWKEQGRFILDGTSREHIWLKYIPQAENPHVINPPSGYVSSANQHPTSQFYPYYYTGGFASYRGRRINQLLAADDTITVEDMKSFQLDNYGVMAEDGLPILLAELDTTALRGNDRRAYDILRSWDLMYERDQVAPTIFTRWWQEVYKGIWGDEWRRDGRKWRRPGRATTTQILRDSVEFLFYRDPADTTKKDRTSLIRRGFRQAMQSMEEDYGNNIQDWQWQKFKRTSIVHLSRSLRPFDRAEIPTDGSREILNATDRTHGPSWRMVVALGDKPEAWGVYPGGQNGNPGSKD
ncbi:MAG: penicillin acylase family protein, partial [Bacteroidota bacterium]